MKLIKKFLSETASYTIEACVSLFTMIIVLSSMLKVKQQKNTLLKVLKNIAEVVYGTEEFMLDEESICFDVDYIYVDPTTYATFLLFVPTNKKFGVNLAQFIRNCVSSCLMDDNADGRFIVKLTNYINSGANTNNFELAKFIGELIDNEPQILGVMQSAPVVESEKKPAPVSEPTPSAMPFSFSNKKQAEAPSKEQKTTSKIGLFSKKEKKNKSSSVPKSADAFSGMAIPGIEAPPREKSISEQIVKDNSLKVNKEIHATDASKTSEKKFTEEAAQIKHFDESADDDGTVIIDMEQSVQASAQKAFIVNATTGEKTIISKSDFRIGRSTDPQFDIDYIISAKNIGRHHATIINKNNNYYIVDNNSLNRTFLNEKQLAPTQEYLLQDSDKLRFAFSEYIFKLD